ncbi:MAG TPA: hypothetical protein EYP78_01960 [Candidatus Omnitrophica bacterium]|nr:hypothetical protein [Candidatus Omnitrophota bacterium]
MREIKRVIFITLVLSFVGANFVYPLSARHHLINMGKSLIEMGTSPLYEVFIRFPQRIKEVYEYEVWGREKPEKRGYLRYKIFFLWRIPGELLKAVIEGAVGMVNAGGKFLKEAVSIFFSD